ncbi:MAG: AAA family ATPase [Draconibacterium sp.]|nr:AAA family ATPase [Draconibacterium sp.]
MSKKTSPRIVVITGAESTGKSTLTEALANHFNVPYIPEIAREYIENLNKKYTYKDVENIAQKQVERLGRLFNTNHPFIFVDTWLIITKIWFEVVFKKTPDWFKSEFEINRIDLFLVCDTDLPWIPDSVRENGGEQRVVLHNKYIETIKKYNFKYEIVRGKGEYRIQNALSHLNKLT